MTDAIVGGLPYPVVVGGEAARHVAAAAMGAEGVAVLYDRRVSTRANAIRRSLTAARLPVLGELAISGGERCKNAATLQRVWRWLVRCGVGRRAVLVAIGGGSITDLAGLAAATYLRGIDWIAVPTTVLGMADAAIGGKTAIDLPEGKNLVGAFWTPRMVAADLPALATLPKRERSGGCAEMIKAAVIGDPELLEALERLPFGRSDARPWGGAIAAAAAVKARIVAADPREAGMREMLNLGHTLGHAFEHASRGRLTHGFAVSIGLRGAGLLALRQGLFSPPEHARVLRCLKRAGLPLCDNAADLRAVERALAVDKKRQAAAPRFVLPVRIGEVRIGMTAAPDDVRDVIAQCTRPPSAEELGR